MPLLEPWLQLADWLAPEEVPLLSVCAPDWVADVEVLFDTDEVDERDVVLAIESVCDDETVCAPEVVSLLLSVWPLPTLCETPAECAVALVSA